MLTSNIGFDGLEVDVRYRWVGDSHNLLDRSKSDASTGQTVRSLDLHSDVIRALRQVEWEGTLLWHKDFPCILTEFDLNLQVGWQAGSVNTARQTISLKMEVK